MAAAVLLAAVGIYFVVPPNLYQWIFSTLEGVELSKISEAERLALTVFAGFVVLHLLAAFLIYSVARGRWLVKALALIALPLSAYLGRVFLQVILAGSQLFPTDVDPHERIRWFPACTLEHAALAGSAPAAFPSMEESGEALLVTWRAEQPHYMLLRTPGCVLTSLSIPVEELAGPPHVVPGGGALFEERDGDWRYFDPNSKKVREVSKPRAVLPHTAPVLSDDGAWVAWLAEPLQRRAEILASESAPSAVSADRALPQILVLSTGDDRDTRGTLERAFSDLKVSSIQLLGFDSRRAEFALLLNRSEYAGVGIDGNLRWGPLTPKAWSQKEERHIPVAIHPESFQSAYGGYVALGTMTEGASQVLFWELPRGTGSFLLPPGYLLSNFTISGDAHYIAFAMTSPKAESSAVVLVAARDESELLRKNFPANAAPRVAFLGEDRFSYSYSFDGPTGEDSRVLVLELDDSSFPWR